MTEYNAKSKNSLSFDITQDKNSVGTLTYKSWFRFDAVINIEGNSSYQIVPKGFWGTTIELKEGEKVLVKFKMNWNGQIVLETYFDSYGKGYTFKQKGIFKESFLLLDESGDELLVVKPIMKWTSLGFEYHISASDRFETALNKEILLMTSVHCANYFMSMMMAGVVAGA